MELEELKQILKVFREEAREIAEAMTAGLLSLEAADEKEKAPLLEGLFRGAHTLKGGAGSLGIDDVAAVAHDVETLLGQCQRGNRAFHPSFTDSILGALDEIGRRLDALLAGQMESGEWIRASRARLARLIGGEVEDVRRVATGTTAAAHQESVVRVPQERIDAIAISVDDLIVQRLRVSLRSQDTSRLVAELDLLARRARGGFGPERLADLKRLAHDLGALARELALDAQHLSSMTDDLRLALRSMQVVPASTILDPFRRSVRDHSRKAGVEAVLDVVGGEIEADRAILEGLRGPLVHLLRNAVDHGIETPEQRKKARKPSRARIRVDVSVNGSQLLIVVSDDGRGIDPAKIRKAAAEKGLFSKEEAARLDDAAAIALVWRSGFSTTNAVTETSGRGVGLDAVRADVEKLGGRIDLATTPGKGSTFRISVPLMRAATIGLLVEAGGVPYLLPLADIHEVRRVHVAELRKVQGVPFLDRSTDSVAVVSLAGVLTGAHVPLQDDERPLVCVIGDEASAVGLAVDRIHGEREMSIRPLGPELERYEHLAGASRTGDGRVVLVLAPGGLVRRAHGIGRAAPRTTDSPTVLVVDDAATSRLLHRTLLEQAGYQVMVAANGEDALEILSTREIDAVLSDVRMPRMDGLELVRRIRRMPGRGELPVILLTSLASETDRRDGLTAGATTYLVKGETPPDRLVEILRGFVA